MRCHLSTLLTLHHISCLMSFLPIQMQLVIYGKEDLDQLQSWANTTFAAIPNKEILPPQPPNPAYPAGFSPRLIVYKPITSNPQLNIVWQTPPRQDLYR